MEYHGVIVTNKSQNLIDYDFIDANIDFTTRNVTNLMDDNYDKRGMFENFFENEVIPKLLSF
jgi:predicted Ser/Thr protein kinase